MGGSMGEVDPRKEGEGGGLGAFNQIELLAEPNERSVNLLLESEPNQRHVSQVLHAKAGKPCTTVVLDTILKPYT